MLLIFFSCKVIVSVLWMPIFKFLFLNINFCCLKLLNTDPNWIKSRKWSPTNQIKAQLKWYYQIMSRHYYNKFNNNNKNKNTSLVFRSFSENNPSQSSEKKHSWSVHLLPEGAWCSHQQECPHLLLSNHHHIPAAWHRSGSHGNRTTRLPLPLVSWQQADEMRQRYCVRGGVCVCLGMTIC